jgi:hypothetical protein
MRYVLREVAFKTTWQETKSGSRITYGVDSNAKFIRNPFILFGDETKFLDRYYILRIQKR